MTTAIYTASLFGNIYRIRADFAQSACQIERENEDGDWVPTGRQVADFSHRSELAMEWELEESFAACGEETTADDDEEISEAVANMEVAYEGEESNA